MNTSVYVVTLLQQVTAKAVDTNDGINYCSLIIIIIILFSRDPLYDFILRAVNNNIFIILLHQIANLLKQTSSWRYSELP